jgi:hypothetical protein
VTFQSCPFFFDREVVQHAMKELLWPPIVYPTHARCQLKCPRIHDRLRPEGLHAERKKIAPCFFADAGPPCTQVPAR